MYVPVTAPLKTSEYPLLSVTFADIFAVIGNVSPLITKIYNIEYGTRDNITVTLPPPLFINVTNTNQLIVNTADYCDSIVNIVMADEQDEILKAKFAKKLKIYHLGSYINMKVVEDMLDKAKQEYAKERIESPGDENGGEQQY